MAERMGVTDELLYEYAVVRYVPRVDREEFINIGLIMMCKRQKWINGLIELDPIRLGSFDPKVDIPGLKRQTSMFMRKDVPSQELPVEEKYRWLSAAKSAIIQVSPSHPGLLPTVSNAGKEEKSRMLFSEFERLFKDLVSF